MQCIKLGWCFLNGEQCKILRKNPQKRNVGKVADIVSSAITAPRLTFLITDANK